MHSQGHPRLPQLTRSERFGQPQVLRVSIIVRKTPRAEKKSRKQIGGQYHIEQDLAGQLRNDGKDERRTLYRTLYDEYCRRVPHNPQALRQLNPAVFEAKAARKRGIVNRL